VSSRWGLWAKSWKLLTATSYARLMRDQGRAREAHDLLAPVYGWFTEGFATKDLKDGKTLLDELSDAPVLAVSTVFVTSDASAGGENPPTARVSRSV
jgi:hypothetical protein